MTKKIIDPIWICLLCVISSIGLHIHKCVIMASLLTSNTFVRRAAFDIGSGSTKIQCSDCEIDENGVIKIIRTYFGQERPVSMGADLLRSTDGNLSEEIQTVGISTLLDLKMEADALGATEFAAVATEVFRKAINGAAYTERICDLGVHVTIVTQTLEAELGFGSVVAVKNLPRHSTCVWDSGGASFQITSENHEYATPILRTFMGSWGTSISTSALVKDVQGRNIRDVQTINPVPKEDAIRLVDVITAQLEEVPTWLQNKDTVFAAAGANSLFKLCCDVLTIVGGDESSVYDSFSYAQAGEALNICVDKTNEELKQFVSFRYADGPNVIVPKLALLVAVMRHTGIKHVQTVPCIGSCAGVLCDPRFWVRPGP